MYLNLKLKKEKEKKKAKTSIHLMLTIACFQYFAFLIPLVKEFYFVLTLFGN